MVLAAENSRRNAMDALLAGDQPLQPGVHFSGRDKFAGLAARQQLGKRPAIQFFGFQTLLQQIDALLKNRADAGIAPFIDQRPGKGVLSVCQRNRRFDRQWETLLNDSGAK